MPPGSADDAIAAVTAAVTALADWKGSSRAAVTKWLAEHRKLDKAAAAKLAADGIKAGAATGALRLEKQTVFVSGLSFPKPADITLVVEELTPPTDAASRAAKAGDTVLVAYEGRLASDGTVFDSAAKFDFALGAGEDEGVAGMRVGQKRRLTAPPKLAYGKRGSPPEIGPDATLVFDVTLLGFE